ncbi:MAG: D-alanyl-D-alanine carboxypeptidase family protein [Polyangiaceae bacterium]
MPARRVLCVVSAQALAAALALLLSSTSCRDKEAFPGAANDAALHDAGARSSGEVLAIDASQASAPDASAEAGPRTSLGYGTPERWTGPTCAPHGDGHFIAEADERTTFVDGRDLLAIVNRSPQGALPPNFAPPDLVDLRTHAPRTEKECEAMPCLRKDAALALDELLAAMKARGFPGSVESTFRSYRAQCVTFSRWAAQSNFCSATEQSALPGHSQHQLGTAIDLFTEQWRKDGDGGVFRNGFGCTDAGAFLRDGAHAYGFVLPYPIHPDDSAAAESEKRSACDTRQDSPVPINPMTGYRNESWHVRYIGKEAAGAFVRAVKERGPEFTLEQWLREQRGISSPLTLPVCDGCNCGACSTLAETGKTPCKNHALLLDSDGNAKAASEEAPTLEHVTVERRKGELRFELRLTVPVGTLTQPPVATLGTHLRVTPSGESPMGASHAGGRLRAFPDLPGTVRIGIGFGEGSEYPTRVALAQRSAADAYNRVNTALPAETGKVRLRFTLSPPDEQSLHANKIRLALLRDGKVIANREIAPRN